MSLINFNFYSKYLAGNTEISVILPDLPFDADPKSFYLSGKKYPVLWLLHGTFGDHTDWLRRSAIELYAIEREIIVVMPSALNSNYSNWKNTMLGYNMYDHLTEELMPMIYGWFPASDKREDNFIAGLSMGGRGCIKYAVNRPELFAGAAALSAAPVNFDEMVPGAANPFLDPENPRTRISIENAGGMDSYINGEENVWAKLDALAGTGKLPQLIFACGEDDALIYPNFLKFADHCKEIGIDIDVFTLPGYRHEWRFWDLSIQHALDTFGLAPKRSF